MRKWSDENIFYFHVHTININNRMSHKCTTFIRMSHPCPWVLHWWKRFAMDQHRTKTTVPAYIERIPTNNNKRCGWTHTHTRCTCGGSTGMRTRFTQILLLFIWKGSGRLLFNQILMKNSNGACTSLSNKCSHLRNTNWWHDNHNNNKKRRNNAGRIASHV